MTKDEALHKALKVLNCLNNNRVYETAWVKGAINACEEALEQPTQEGEGVVLGGWQLRYCGKDWVSREVYENLIKQPAQEPNCYGDGNVYRGLRSEDSKVKTYHVNTHHHQWQGLTELEQWNLINKSDIPADYDHELLAIARDIEQTLRIKNDYQS